MSHISIPLWVLIIAALWIVAFVNAWRDHGMGGYASGLSGCLGLMFAAMGTLAVLLAHAWGWV